MSEIVNPAVERSIHSPPPGDEYSRQEYAANAARYVRRLVAGAEVPKRAAPPAFVTNYLNREFGSSPAPPPDARRDLEERLTLRAEYGGEVVACVRAADGRVAVVARGEAEIDALLTQLDDPHASRVSIHYPQPL